MLGIAASGLAQGSGLVVLYPEIRQPYARLYEDILSGIRETYRQSVHRVTVDKSASVASLQERIVRLSPDVMIALGQRSLGFADEISPRVPIIAGALNATAFDGPGISMTPDGHLVIDKLMLFIKKPQTIYVVTDFDKRKQQLARAQDYATTKGFSFNTHHARNIQEAANEYRRILNKINQGDAIWLMRDKSLHDPAILSQVLETAWKRRVAVFSSNPSDVKRGALFAIYPDNVGLGKTLGLLAMRRAAGEKVSKAITPLRDLHTVVNGRTSRHLGVILSGEVRAQIDSVL